MPELKVVDKDTLPSRKRSLVEVHWKTPDGKYDVDLYPGGCILERDMSGLLTVQYEQEDDNGEEFTVFVTYGYGEDRKVIEIFK